MQRLFIDNHGLWQSMGLLILLFAFSLPAIAHPGSGTPSYLSIQLWDLTTTSQTPTGDAICDTTIGGSSVLMCVQIQHEALVSVQSVVVKASEQQGSWNGPMQVLTINGFTLFQSSQTTDTTDGGTLTTEYWTCIVDTRPDYNNANWPSPLERGSNFVAPMFNATYSFDPIVVFSIAGLNISSDSYSSVNVEPEQANVVNLNISRVTTNVTDSTADGRFLIYNPGSSTTEYQIGTVNFSINGIEGDDYQWEIYFWPTAPSRSDAAGSCDGYMTDYVTSPGPVQVEWEGETYSGGVINPDNYGVYNFDILVTDLTNGDTQWYKSIDGMLTSVSLTENSGLYNKVYSVYSSISLFSSMLFVLCNDEEPAYVKQPFYCSSNGTYSVTFADPSTLDPTTEYSRIRAVQTAMASVALQSRDHSDRPVYCCNQEMNPTWLCYVSSQEDDKRIDFNTISNYLQLNYAQYKNNINVRTKPSSAYTGDAKDKWVNLCQESKTTGTNLMNKNVIVVAEGITPNKVITDDQAIRVDISNDQKISDSVGSGTSVYSNNTVPQCAYDISKSKVKNQGINVMLLLVCKSSPYIAQTINSCAVNSVYAPSANISVGNAIDETDKNGKIIATFYFTEPGDTFIQSLLMKAINGNLTGSIKQITYNNDNKIVPPNIEGNGTIAEAVRDFTKKLFAQTIMITLPTGKQVPLPSEPDFYGYTSINNTGNPNNKFWEAWQ